jgi:two-component system response regulator DesR
VIRTLLAMPGGLLRGALRYVLTAQEDIDVIAELDDLDEVITAVREDRPDVTVLDLDIIAVQAHPGGCAVNAETPEGKVLVLVDPCRPGLIGVKLASSPPGIGFLARTVQPELVLDAIRRLVRDERVLDGELVVAALRPKGPLTASELRVLQAVAVGWPVKEIAVRLSIRPGTVRSHLSRIIAKTGARTRLEAIHIAQQAGWI